MEFYDTFDFNKKKHKLNNAQIGKVIGMEPDTLRMAVKRGSLSPSEIKKIEKYFNDYEKGIIPGIITNEMIDDLFENKYFIQKLDEYNTKKAKKQY